MPTHSIFAGMADPLPTPTEGQIWRELDPRQKPTRKVEVISVESTSILIATTKDGKLSTRVSRVKPARFDGVKSNYGYWTEDQSNNLDTPASAQ